MESVEPIETKHNQAVWGLASSSRNQLISGSLDGSVKIWAFKDEQLSQEADFPNSHSLGVTCTDISSSGEVALSTALDNKIVIYDMNTLRVARQIQVNAGAAFKACFSPDGTRIAACGRLGKVVLYSTETGELQDTIDTLSGQFLMSIKFAPCGGYFACGTNQGVIYTFDVVNLSVYRKFTVHHLPIRALAYSPDGYKLAAGCDDGRITIYDPTYQSVLGSLIGHSSWVTSMQIVREDIGDVLLSGSCDTSLRFWDLTNMSSIANLKVGGEVSNLPYQVWCAAQLKLPGRLSKVVAGLESGFLSLYDQPFFKSK
ncbi:Ski complex subunit Rec14 [Entomophthora muscae]|uniref:Ski complex subunit Rec14 n=1 Tax=Entomophthora muscae TaxID=34485 RepID=A0ACC2SBW4_9FUNG|nr:Ski complex subunit Rec14 [Entomophthora muscae]